jgi:hypothetical protein
VNVTVARKTESIKEILMAAELVQGYKKNGGGQKEESSKKTGGDDAWQPGMLLLHQNSVDQIKFIPHYRYYEFEIVLHHPFLTVKKIFVPIHVQRLFNVNTVVVHYR